MRSINNNSNTDDLLGIPFQNFPVSNDQIIIYQVDSNGNGYFIFGSISSAGGISVVNSSGIGASLINNVSGGTLTLKSILSTNPNIGINNLGNQIELTMGPNLMNIFSITNLDSIEIHPGVKAYRYELQNDIAPTTPYDFMIYEAPNGSQPGYYFSINDSGTNSDRELIIEGIKNGIKTTPVRIDNSGNIYLNLPTITPINTVGISLTGELGVYANPTTLNNIINIGNGDGEIYENTISGTVRLRTINGDNTILVNTLVDTVNLSLSPDLLNVTSINGGNLAITNPNISFPGILSSTSPDSYLGLDNTGSGPQLVYFTPPSSSLSIANAGTGAQLYKSLASNLLTMKSLAVGLNLGLTDDTNTLTVSLNNNININSITGPSLVLSSTTTSILGLTTLNSPVTAVVRSGTGQLYQSDIKTTFTNGGSGSQIYVPSSDNIANFNTLVAGNSIGLSTAGGQVTIAVGATMANMQVVNSATSLTTFNNNVRLNTTTTTTSPPFYLSLDASNNITKTVPPASTGNIYNTDGTLTQLTRTINPFNTSTNNKIVYNNIYDSCINSIKYNPTYLGTTQNKVESAFTKFYDSAGDSWGKYEATNYENRVVTIPALGSPGNFNTFYISRADGTLQNAAWLLRVFVYENAPLNNSPFIAVYDIVLNAPNNNNNYQSVYPKWCTNNQSYLLELGQAVVSNNFTMFLRLRNYGTTSINNTVMIKVESYGVADKDVTTPLTTGNLAINTVGATFPMSIPIISQNNSSTNPGNSLPSILWVYNNWPRQVRVVYDISAQSAIAGIFVTLQFTNNSVNIHQRTMRTGTNNTFTSVSGSFILDVPIARATGALLSGNNTFTVTATTNPTAINFKFHTYLFNFEFVN